MTFPQAPALPEELDKLMRRMRLPYMRKAAPDVLATARAQRWDPAEVLRLLIAEEDDQPNEPEEVRQQRGRLLPGFIRSASGFSPLV
ncbi:hypothetical protein [Streptomyces sp. NPDC055134]